MVFKRSGMKKKFLIWFFGAVALLAGGVWFSRPPSKYDASSGYEIFYNRPRFGGRLRQQFTHTTNGVIKVAAQQEACMLDIWWKDFEILEGSITLTGSNFTLRLKKDSKATLEIQGDGEYKGVVNKVVAFVTSTQWREPYLYPYFYRKDYNIGWMRQTDARPYIYFPKNQFDQWMRRTSPDAIIGKRKYEDIYAYTKDNVSTFTKNNESVPYIFDGRRKKLLYPILHHVETNDWFYIDIAYSVSTNFQGKLGKVSLRSTVHDFLLMESWEAR